MTKESYLYQATTSNLEFYYKNLEYLNSRISLLNQFSEKNPALEKNELYKDLLFQLEFNGVLTISMLDLSLISRELSISQQAWQILYYKKQASLLVYETLNTINSHAHNLLTLTQKTPKRTSDAYRIIVKKIRLFKKEYNYSSELKNIRNKIGGHIDKDFQTYFENLKVLKDQDIGVLLIDFVTLLSDFLNFTKMLLKENSKLLEMELRKREEESITKLLDIHKIVNEDNH